METLFSKGRVRLYREDGRLCLTDGLQTYEITSHPYEPCLYLKDPGGWTVVVHNSYEAEWIASLSGTYRTLRSITGNAYDLEGLCRLMLLAGREGEDTDISDLEALDVMERLSERGAVSESTAIHPRDLGLSNLRILYDVLHARELCQLPDGRCYIPQAPGNETPVYPIPIKEGTLRERIGEMMALAGDDPGRFANLQGLRKMYDDAGVGLFPEGERFLTRYAYLFSQLSPGFADERDNRRFFFETFDTLPQGAGAKHLMIASGMDGRAIERAGCPVTPVGIYGFGSEPPYVYVGENGRLYAYGDYSDEVREYPSLIDLLEDALRGHPPVGLDD